MQELAEVYPRVCGGTYRCIPCRVCHGGLSPRVRGNLVDVRRCGRSTGSIPACAGEPQPPGRAGHPGEVYPRVCGGTRPERLEAERQYGLSPRVRGNPPRLHDAFAGLRSIPACAGEPVTHAGRRPLGKVYPRVCGGTQALLSKPPPVTVYPRVCGGTRRFLNGSRFVIGLSPRVRGNRYTNMACSGGNGSIPACAGEPPQGPRARRQLRVYPRVCGGTSLGLSTLARILGLSPRVRGNRRYV